MELTLDWTHIYVIAGFACVLRYLLQRRNDPLRNIPAVGPTAPLLSYWGAYRFIRYADEVLREGYRKYNGSAFKVAGLDGWLVIISGAQLIEDLRKRDDTELSAVEGVEALFQFKHTLGPHFDNQFHVPVVRDQLTRGVAALFPDVLDEVITAFEELVPATDEGEWVSVHAYPTIKQVVARASNRVILGLPYCRDPYILNIAINFANDVIAISSFINLFPSFLKPVIGGMFARFNRNKTGLMTKVIPMLEERERMLEAHGDGWSEKPHDLLQWLLEEGRAVGTSSQNIIEKILLVNFGAIHTSSSAFTHALFNLAAHPEYVGPMREEIKRITDEEGWTKASMGKMRKVDSFLKESMRLVDGSILTMYRKAMKDVMLADGTLIPAGTMLAVDSLNAHHDGERYDGPTAFDPFRFARMREPAAEAVKHQLVNTSLGFLTFGHGKHACPGRFFAASELKTMMAYVLVNYDVKFEDGRRPENLSIGPAVIPAPQGRVLFRKRKAS